MSDTILRRLVGAALILLFVYQATVMVIGMVNAAAGGATAVFVAAVTFFCAQRANAGVGMGNRLWFMLPALLFTVLPLGLQAWSLYTSETSVWAWVAGFAPLLIGFVVPVFLLWLTYAELRKRTRVAVVPANPAASEE